MNHWPRQAIAAAAAAMTVLLSMIVYAPHAHAATRQPIEIVERDLSHLPTVTLTISGAPLAGPELPWSSFGLTEAGHTMPVTVNRVGSAGVEVVLAIDTSGSMAGAPIAAAKEAAIEFVRTLPAGTRISVVGIGPSPKVALPFTNDTNAAVAAIAALQAAGETALYDGLVTAAGQFSSQAGARHAIVLLSDGGDTASRAHIDDAIVAVNRASASVSAVSLLTKESDTSSLSRIATSSRGALIPVNEPGALHEAYAAVAGDLVGRYRVTYTTSSHGATPVTVHVQAHGGAFDIADSLGLPAAAASSPAVSAIRRALGNPVLLAAGAALFFLAMALGLFVLLVPASVKVRLAAKQASAAGVSGLAQRASAAAERTLERRGQRRSLENALDQAGIAMRPGEALVIAAAIVTASVLAGGLFAGLLGAVLLALVAVLGCKLVLGYLRDRRRRQFANQLDSLLQLLAGSLRTGYGLVQALDAAAREAESPTSDELRRLNTEIRLGRDLGDALQTMASRVASEDFEWVAQAIGIHREIGGDLAEVLDRVSETIRARNQLARQVRSLTAEGRMSAYVLVALPIGLLALIRLTNPSYLKLLTSSGLGIALAAGGAALLGVGVLWLRKLIRPVY